MTIKRIFLTALMIGTINNITLPTNSSQKTVKSTPNIRLEHSATHRGYEVKTNLKIKAMNQETLEMFKKIGKGNDFTICTFVNKNGSKDVRVFNPQSPFIKEFNTCAVLADLVSNLSADDTEQFEKYIFSEE